MPRVLDLWSRSGYITTPDGNSICIWGFTYDPTLSAQLPGPTLVLNHGEMVTITLHNDLSENVSMLFPGQSGVEYQESDGTWHPVQPRFSGTELISVTNFAQPGGTITYRFIPNNPGTYVYESGTKPCKQVHMGLSGTVVVRPTDFDVAKTAYGQGTATDYDREYLIVVAEIDPEFHKAVEKGLDIHPRRYKPRYWTINGRCAPDTMLGDNVGYMPAQPYGSMIMMEPGERVLLRYVNVGLENHPLHLHGNHTRVVAVDGRRLMNGTTDLSYNRFTVLMGSGQSYDLIFSWTGLGYTPGSPIPTPMPGIRNLRIGDAGWTMWSGSSYLGEMGDVPVGVVSLNLRGEYYFMLHSHEEPQITNWGEFPGGMMSMLAVFPPGTLWEDTGVIRG